MRRLVVVLIAVVLGLAACSGGGGPDVDEAVLVVDGVATILDTDGDERSVTDRGTVSIGEVVTISEGTATLELADGSRYELRAGDPGSRVEMAIPPGVLDGDVLIVAGFPARLTVGDALLSATGPAAVDFEAGTVRVFGGIVTGTAVGDGVRALRTVAVAGTGGAVPITYDGADEWDRRFLGESIAFGERLEALARGYTSELRREGPRGVVFFEAVIPQLASEREFAVDLLEPGRDLGETLVGAAIAVQGRDGPFRERWSEIFEFRGAGAVWGLVALEQGVSAAPVLETIDLAIVDTPTVVEQRPRPPTTSPTTRPTPTTQPGPGNPPPPPPPPTTEPPPPPPEDEPPLDPILDPLPPGVGEPVQDLLDALQLGG